MQFLFLWLGTSVASFGIEIANELRLYKDIADAGYKVNTERLLELRNQVAPESIKFSRLSLLIPLFNMVQVFQNVIQYNNSRLVLLDQLSVIDAIEEMSSFEKIEYLKNPTGLNALIVTLKSENRLLNAKSLKIDGNSEHNKIYYEAGEDINDITILKTTGTASRLSVEEQKEKVVEREKIKRFLEKLSNESLEEYEEEKSTQVKKGLVLKKVKK